MARNYARAAGLLLGTGAAVLAGTGAMTAQAATGGSACQQVQGTLSSIQSALPKAASNPSALSSKIASYASQLEQQASSGPPALKSAVNTFVSDLKAAGSGHVNVAKLTSDGKAIGAACSSQATAPAGAPGTGGGSAAGSQDPVLFGLGGAAVLVGAATLGVALRGRRRNGTVAG